jgi:hypothetical protein
MFACPCGASGASRARAGLQPAKSPASSQAYPLAGPYCRARVPLGHSALVHVPGGGAAGVAGCPSSPRWHQRPHPRARPVRALSWGRLRAAHRRCGGAAAHCCGFCPPPGVVGRCPGARGRALAVVRLLPAADAHIFTGAPDPPYFQRAPARCPCGKAWGVELLFWQAAPAAPIGAEHSDGLCMATHCEVLLLRVSHSRLSLSDRPQESVG